jgi:hypothetical protein
MAIVTSKDDLARTINLSGAVIPRTNLSRANLSGADLSLANLTGANLSMALLVGTNLAESVLADANLAHADLSNADLTKADLSRANVSGARFDGADLNQTKLHETDLRNANLSGALNLTWHQLFDGWLDDTTKLPDYLSEVGLLDYFRRVYYALSLPTEYAGRSEELLKYLGELTEQLQKKSLSSTLATLWAASIDRQQSVHVEQRNDG